MYDKIEPLTPMREPTVVSNGLSSTNPSATRAKPEYALRTVMTTAAIVSQQFHATTAKYSRMSAPPIAAVVV